MDIRWIKITTDIFDDTKIRMLEALPSGDSLIVIWFKILTLCGKTNMGGLLMFTDKMPYTDEMLSSIFNRDIVLIKTALQTFEEFGMIETMDNAYYLPNWEKHQNIDGMEKIREQNRLRKQKQRAKEKEQLLAEDVSRDVSREVTQQNKKEDKEKEINIFFDECWSKYPKKRGKSQVKFTQRKKIYEVGKDMFTAIERYTKEVKGKDEQYILNGSTFFNGRYEDYIGDDYKPTVTVVAERPQPKRIELEEWEKPDFKPEPMPKELREKMRGLFNG